MVESLIFGLYCFYKIRCQEMWGKAGDVMIAITLRKSWSNFMEKQLIFSAAAFCILKL